MFYSEHLSVRQHFDQIESALSTTDMTEGLVVLVFCFNLLSVLFPKYQYIWRSYKLYSTNQVK